MVLREAGTMGGYAGWTCVFLLFVWMQGGLSLKNVKLEVPSAVPRGESVKLVCLYDLEGAPLYSVKWYKGRREFYRYVPKEAPQTKVFPFPGIQVDLSLSNAHQVVLRNMQLALSGTYSCEVSADAPSFVTSFISQDLVVVDLPDGKPSIQVSKNRYEVGQRINASCTSLRSKPAANLTFLVNDVQVSRTQLLNLQPHMDDAGLESAVVLLDFPLTQRDFIREKLSLKCIATIFSLYRDVRETILEESGPRPASVLGTRESLPAQSGRSSLPRFMELLLVPSVLLSTLHSTWRR